MIHVVLILTMTVSVFQTAVAQTGVDFIETPATAGPTSLRPLFFALDKARESTAWQASKTQARLTNFNFEDTYCFENAIVLRFDQTQKDNSDIDTLTFSCGPKPWILSLQRPIGEFSTDFISYFYIDWLNGLANLKQYTIHIENLALSLHRYQAGHRDVFELTTLGPFLQFKVRIIEEVHSNYRMITSTIEMSGSAGSSLMFIERKNADGLGQRQFYDLARSTELDLSSFRLRYVRNIIMPMALLSGTSMF